MIKLDAERENARGAGQLAAGSVLNWAGTCPFPHGPDGLRTAWMDGFSEGRVALTMTMLPQEKPSHVDPDGRVG